MPDGRRVELDELIIRPGTYFNPQTEIVLVVDDSPDIDTEIFDMEEYEGAEWLVVSDEVPIDDRVRDELLEAFQIHVRAGSAENEGDGDTDTDDELEADHEDPGRE